MAEEYIENEFIPLKFLLAATTASILNRNLLQARALCPRHGVPIEGPHQVTALLHYGSHFLF